jgi:alkylhydroperoxidase/carboxymuconolactone decarboxylase family protein YurZ
MPRVPPLDAKNASPEAGELLEGDLKAHGYVLNSTRVAAYRPDIAAAAKALGRVVAEGRLIPQQLRLLMNVRIAALVGCPF